MSRAFVKEDVDLPERSGRKQTASELPPGAVNHITGSGAGKLQADFAQMRSSGADPERVDPPDTASQSISFGGESDSA